MYTLHGKRVLKDFDLNILAFTLFSYWIIINFFPFIGMQFNTQAITQSKVYSLLYRILSFDHLFLVCFTCFGWSLFSPSNRKLFSILYTTIFVFATTRARKWDTTTTGATDSRIFFWLAKNTFCNCPKYIQLNKYKEREKKPFVYF